MPASTLRAWFIGIVWAVVIPGVNQFFYFRYPTVTITAVCVPPPFSHRYSKTELHRYTLRAGHTFAFILPNGKGLGALYP